MNLFDRIRHLFQSRKQQLCLLWYRQGLLDGRNEVLKQQSLPGLSELPDVPTIDLAQVSIHTEDPVSAVPGDKLHAWGQAHKPGYRPIRLLPAPAVQHTDFPWLPDENWMNSRLSALHQLLDTETEERPAVVKEFHERKNKLR